MIKSLVLALVLLGSANALAAEVRGARLDASGANVLVDVRYGGGCEEHTFELKLLSCGTVAPVSCTAQLVETGPFDACEALKAETVSLSLVKFGLGFDRLDGATLTIVGDKNSSGVESSATVTLPGANEPVVAPTRPAAPVAAPAAGTPVVEKDTRCQTHTGSRLTINNKTATLLTTDGTRTEYKVVSDDFMVIETNPSIAQSTYTLDDGRKVVTEFRGNDMIGEGYFIRLTGDASPHFQCVRP